MVEEKSWKKGLANWSDTPILQNGHFWRTPEGMEVDLALRVAGRVVPIEVKHAMHLRAEDYQGVQSFMDLYHTKARKGVLISMHTRVERLAENIWNFPLGLLLHGAS